MIRVLTVSDLHCGHRAGLTPPKYQSRIHGDDFYKFQVESWDWLKYELDVIKPIHTLVINGDAVEGQGERSGSTEMIAVDPLVQCKMVLEFIEMVGAKNVYMTYGTASHTGRATDYEKIIADTAGAPINSRQWLTFYGKCFEFKHHISGTTTPHGKGTPLSKEWIWSKLWSLRGEQPNADVIIRSHVHNYFQVGDLYYTAMTLPALQGKGSKYGARVCSGTVEYGFVYFDIREGGRYTWQPVALQAKSQIQKAIVVI